MLRRLTILLGCAVCLLVMSAPAFAAANDCDRACLKTALEQYMNAVTMHKPSAAPLFAGFRQTENAVVVPLERACGSRLRLSGKCSGNILMP